MSARCLQAASSLTTLPHHVLGDLVVLASIEAKPGAKLSLTFGLLRLLARLEPRRHAPPVKNTLTLHKSALGRPAVLLGEEGGPSLSFSRGKGWLWAAMGDQGSVGIDVAYPQEFADGYPFARAFRPEELEWAEAFCHDTARGAALVWSAKEAAVKATGTGFNLIDPLEVRVGTPRFIDHGMVFDVSADRPIAAWSGPEDEGWLSVALVER